MYFELGIGGKGVGGGGRFSPFPSAPAVASILDALLESGVSSVKELGTM